jgi:preprotein translocase subunit Sec63
VKQWKFKIIGLLLGLLTRRPHFIVLGLVVGHLLDIGFFSKKSNSKDSPSTPANSRPVADANPYVVLDIPESASMDEIEQAYRRKISDYHPDKVANAAPELKELAEQRAREINAAYDELQKMKNES